MTLEFRLKKHMYKIFLSLIIGLSSCANLADYQKTYVNDDELQIGLSSIESLNNNAKTYREGAQGANNGKSGGGCGCN